MAVALWHPGVDDGGNISATFTGPLIDVNGSGEAILAGSAFNSGTGLGTLNINSLYCNTPKLFGTCTFAKAGLEQIIIFGMLSLSDEVAYMYSAGTIKSRRYILHVTL